MRSMQTIRKRQLFRILLILFCICLANAAVTVLSCQRAAAADMEPEAVEEQGTVESIPDIINSEGKTGIEKIVIDLITAFSQNIMEGLLGLQGFLFGNISDIVMQTGKGFTLFYTFSFDRGNIYGVVSAMAYSVLRAVAYLVLTVQLIFSIVQAIVGVSTGEKAAQLKESISGIAFAFLLLALAPMLLKQVLTIRNSITATVITGVYGEESADFGAAIIKFCSQVPILGLLMFLAFFFFCIRMAVDYAHMALSSTVGVMILPFCFILGPKSIRSRLANWVGMMAGNLLLPVIDTLLLAVPCLISNADLPASMIVGKLFAILVACWGILPTRQVVMRWIGVSDSGALAQSGSAIRAVQESWRHHSNKKKEQQQRREEAEQQENEAEVQDALAQSVSDYQTLDEWDAQNSQKGQDTPAYDSALGAGEAREPGEEGSKEKSEEENKQLETPAEDTSERGKETVDGTKEQSAAEPVEGGEGPIPVNDEGRGGEKQSQAPENAESQNAGEAGGRKPSDERKTDKYTKENRSQNNNDGAGDENIDRTEASLTAMQADLEKQEGLARRDEAILIRKKQDLQQEKMGLQQQAAESESLYGSEETGLREQIAACNLAEEEARTKCIQNGLDPSKDEAVQVNRQTSKALSSRLEGVREAHQKTNANFKRQIEDVDRQIAACDAGIADSRGQAADIQEEKAKVQDARRANSQLSGKQYQASVSATRAQMAQNRALVNTATVDNFEQPQIYAALAPEKRAEFHRQKAKSIRSEIHRRTAGSIAGGIIGTAAGSMALGMQGSMVLGQIGSDIGSDAAASSGYEHDVSVYAAAAASTILPPAAVPLAAISAGKNFVKAKEQKNKSGSSPITREEGEIILGSGAGRRDAQDWVPAGVRTAGRQYQAMAPKVDQKIKVLSSRAQEGIKNMNKKINSTYESQKKDCEILKKQYANGSAGFLPEQSRKDDKSVQIMMQRLDGTGYNFFGRITGKNAKEDRTKQIMKCSYGFFDGVERNEKSYVYNGTEYSANQLIEHLLEEDAARAKNAIKVCHRLGVTGMEFENKYNSTNNTFSAEGKRDVVSIMTVVLDLLDIPQKK